MGVQAGLKDLSTHFRFGENWKDFSRRIDADAIDKARLGLSHLLPPGRIEGARFLDIGCGSGLHALAALQLGAREVVAIDIDPASVETSRAVLDRFGDPSRASVAVRSVFDTDPAAMGRFDIVYSWGVLHHSGALWAAVEKAGRLVAPGGLFAVALYRKTALCRLWAVEKRIYAHAPAPVQAIIRGLYKAAFVTALVLTGRNPVRYVRDYSKRGMAWGTDIHDWLGGYPYESASAEEVEQRITAAGFRALSIDRRPGGLGLFGSGCSEYVFERAPA